MVVQIGSAMTHIERRMLAGSSMDQQTKHTRMKETHKIGYGAWVSEDRVKKQG